MGIDCKRHPHLPESEFQGVSRMNPDIGVEHLYRAFVGEIDFSLVSYNGYYSAVYAYPGIADFKPPFCEFWLVFILGTYCAVDFRHV